jgi:putative beta-lysine N-acetyltransferase
VKDRVTRIGEALIQHGSENDRVYLMKLGSEDPAGTVQRLEALARQEGYAKIIAKVPQGARDSFAAADFRHEAHVPGFYRGRQDVHFMAKYLQEERRQPRDPQTLGEVLEVARNRQPDEEPPHLSDRYRWRIAEPSDAEAMAALYRQVFATYPFPIHDPEYLLQTMADHIVYFGIWDRKELVALASAEMDVAGGNAEMTDFATQPAFRGEGFATFLLARMEEEMRRRRLPTAYTIARAVSFGMNITFARCGYRFGGTLTNNTNISGSLESMNVWYKPMDLAGCLADATGCG